MVKMERDVARYEKGVVGLPVILVRAAAQSFVNIGKIVIPRSLIPDHIFVGEKKAGGGERFEFFSRKIPLEIVQVLKFIRLRPIRGQGRDDRRRPGIIRSREHRFDQGKYERNGSLLRE